MIYTNDLKKGTQILLSNGWGAILYDNKKGNIRLAEVDGDFKEIGSIYAHDIREAFINGKWEAVTLTDKQKELRLITL
jgi:hypothetical protein